MKRQTTTIIILLTAILFFVAASANAQSNRRMKVIIPFEFVIGEKTYDAGEYTIGRLNPQKPSILILKKIDGKEKKIFLTQNMRSKTILENTQIVFSKYEDSYFLSEIWTGGTKKGLRLMKGKDERKVLLIAKAKQEKVVLTASLFTNQK